MAKKPPPRKKTTPTTQDGFWLRALVVCGEVMNRIGMIGFIFIATYVFVVAFATAEQKQALVDMWFLFKAGSHLNCIIIVYGLVMLIVMQHFHMRNVNRMDQTRLNKMAEEKTSLQSRLTGGRLGSSEPPKQ